MVISVQDEQKLLDAGPESLAGTESPVTYGIVVVLDSCIDLGARLAAVWQRRVGTSKQREGRTADVRRGHRRCGALGAYCLFQGATRQWLTIS